MKQFILIIAFFLFLVNALWAQPANDNCTNPTIIEVSNNGYGLGTFTGALTNMSAATMQTGETVPPSVLISGLNRRSVWYKFYIASTRSVTVTLGQPTSSIQAGNVGFAVYKANQCLPGNAQISTKLSPIETFGNTFHPCVDSGYYLVQVASNLNANDVIFINVTVEDPAPSLYDKTTNPGRFGQLNNQKSIRQQFEVECQGIESIDEVCLPNTSFKGFTKSTWHTVTTPDYIDYLGFTLSESIAPWNAPEYTVGFQLYEGDVETVGINGLTLVSGCDSFRTNGYYPDRKVFKCGEIKPNTTYSVKLLYRNDFIKTMRFSVVWDGSGPTNGPLPVNTINIKNRLGVLNANANGINNFGYDTLSCNSYHNNGCGVAKEPDGFLASNNYRYRLSTFFTFSLATSTSLRIWANSPSCNQIYPWVRLYKQAPGANCTDMDEANLVSSFYYNGTVNCLPAGDYVVQVLGSDTLRPKTNWNYNNFPTTTTSQCLLQHLGKNITLQIQASTEVPTNRFSLSGADSVSRVNAVAGVMQPLVQRQNYVLQPDTFGCANTVLPNDPNLCEQKDKAVYRTMVVADSAIMYHASVSQYYYKLYKGDANALAVAQNKFNPGELIDGLDPVSKCAYFNSTTFRGMCVTPGTYTLVSFGSEAMLSLRNVHTIRLGNPVSKFTNPASPENLGDLLDTLAKLNRNNLTATPDTFTCFDNAVTIDGLEPCTITSQRPASKLIYRQFYLSSRSRVAINGASTNGRHRLFAGKVSDEGTAGLKALGSPWNCFTSASTGNNDCDGLVEGWYTIVTYGDGPTFTNPLGINTDQFHYSFLGQATTVNIAITPACPSPKNNRPYKASVNAAGQPHNVDWTEQPTHTAAYPVRSTTINLPSDYFDCTNDTPFATHPILACNPSATGVNKISKVSYHVWQITKPAYIQITFPAGMWGIVFDFDVRTADSLKLTTATPIQACMERNGAIQLCKMQPGVYTLAIFGRENMICNTITPTFYIDEIGYSRFDHANNAYDFGTLIPDKQYRNGKPGDVNPLNGGRAPSNDFFYCTTGAQERDPSNAACYSKYNPEILNPANNVALYPNIASLPATWEIARRNLWYTFTIDDPGRVFIKVENKTPGKMHQYNFAVYRSDVDGSLDFDQVKAAGEVDSTIAQGLTYLGNNLTGYYCYATPEISIYNDPCTFKPTRYYVLVENRNPYAAANIHAMNPNSQVEVSLRLDSVQVIKPKFDFYSGAAEMGTLGVGKFTGETDNFTCATRNLPDPVNGTLNACQKTLWYKFTTTVTGNIRYRVSYNTTSFATNNQIQLFRQNIPGDSTANGLQFLPSAGTQSAGGFTWMRRCISPGTYYILLPGCNAVGEEVFPEIEILEQEGDFCNKPMVTALNGPGDRVLPVIIDCHTIGTDYGEFNPTLTCPAGAQTALYKTTWYRLDVGGTDTLDITVFIDEKTNATPAQIKYRMMTGTCAAMQEQSCVQDALTRNTYECLVPGNSYYIQVFTPVQLPTSPFTVVTGSIDLNISAIKHVGTCNPADPCIAVANFTPEFDCTVDRNVTFVNYSTFGTDIAYEWDFGYNSQTSTQVSPQFFYPALTTDQSYQVRLIVINTDCGKRDTIIQQVQIPARPSVNLGPDVVNCINGTTSTFDATSHPGSTYRWSTNSTLPTASFNTTSSRWVEVTYNNCKARDTVNIWNNPIVKRPVQTSALCNTDLVTLNANRGQSEQYTWSNGATNNSISVGVPGYYWADLFLNGCTVRDSFLVVSTEVSPLGNDTTVCEVGGLPFTARATLSGATAYRWQNNSTAQTFNITQPGIYWVDITLGGCTFRDSLLVAVDSVTRSNLTINLCPGTSYTLPSGRVVNTTGNFIDTLPSSNGCDSIITNLNLSVDGVQTVTVSAQLCDGQSYTLPSGEVVNQPGFYSDILKSVDGCDSLLTEVTLTASSVSEQDIQRSVCEGDNFTLPSGKVVLGDGIYQDTLRYAGGCDSIRYTINLTTLVKAEQDISVSLCAGESYTLPSGLVVNTSGLYRDTLRYVAGCDSSITNITITANPVSTITQNASICAGSSYTLPGGIVVNAAGTYPDTLRYTSGCDSIRYSIQLQVADPIRQTTNATICAGASYTLPSGRIVSTTGIYLDTLRAVAGCDSLITTLNLQEAGFAINNVSATLCQGETYSMPSGTIVNATGLYRDTLRYEAGCDSSITIVTITANPVSTITQNASICAGSSYTLPGGIVVNAAGTYPDTLRYTSGCDSIRYSIQLQVADPIRQTTNATICAGASYSLPSGRIVSTTGTYLDTVKAVAGCDSLITTLILQEAGFTINNVSATLCTGETYSLPSGTIVNATGLYRDTLRYAAGCDSVITNVTITANAVSTVIQNASICAGSTYMLPGGAVVSTAGTYLDTLRYTSGCDSIRYSIQLQVADPIRQTTNATICAGADYTLPSGRIVNATGTYLDTVRAVAGCDSLITTLILQEAGFIINNVSVSLCSGENYTLPSGTIVNATGLYRDTLRYAAGCDSVITNVTITANAVSTLTQNASICAGSSYTLPSGSVVNTAGTYLDTLRYTSGCDSFQYSIQLQLINPILETVNARICAGQNYALPNGRLVSIAGNYRDTLKSVNGCDSMIINTLLNLDEVLMRNITATICQGGFYQLPGGNFVNTAGIFLDTLKNIRGCDSIRFRIALQFTPVIRTNTSATICLGASFTLPGGRDVTTAGVYRDTLKTNSGCDSIITTTLTTTPPLRVTLTGPARVCEGATTQLTATASGGNGGPYSFVWTNTSSNSTTATVTVDRTSLYAVAVSDGCTVEEAKAQLSIEAVPLPVVNAGADTAVAAGVGFVLRPSYSADVNSYRWTPSNFLNCTNCATPTATPREGITYSIAVRNAFGCEASDSKTINLVCNAESVFLPNTFTPNGDGMNDIWYPRGSGIRTIRYLKVFNRWGQVVFERTNFNADDRSAGWDGTFKGTLLSPDVYVYTLGMTCQNGQALETKGNVMIVR